MTNLFIFNTDFRVRDNPALFYAAENGESLVAMFIHNPKKWESHNESDLKIAFQIDNLKNISRKFAELNISLKVIHAEGIEEENKKIIEFIKKQFGDNIEKNIIKLIYMLINFKAISYRFNFTYLLLRTYLQPLQMF